MRAHQLSPENATSVRPRVGLVGIPIRCRCIAPVNPDRYRHFTRHIVVRVNGLVIEDAQVTVEAYVENGRYATVEFTGTIAIFAAGIEPAIRAARLPDIRLEGWVEGQARELKIDINGEVVMVSPVSGKIFSLVGAE